MFGSMVSVEQQLQMRKVRFLQKYRFSDNTLYCRKWVISRR